MTTPSSLPLDRNGMEVLDLDTCMELARTVRVARVAVNGPASPLVLPVLHHVAGNQLVFRSPPGSKLDAAIMNREVTVQVDDWSEDQRTGWSVLVHGTADTLEDPDITDLLDHATEDPWIEPGQEMHWVVVRPNEVTGRRIVRS